MAKLVLTSIGSRYGSIDALNANFQAIEDAFENTFSLDGTVPNALEHELDAGSFRIINLGTPTATSDAVTKQYVDSITGLLNSYVDEIATVANNITDVVTVADNIADVVAVAPNIALVAGSLTEIEAVAQNIGSVELVGLDLNGAFISGVIYDFGSITEDPVGEERDGTPNPSQQVDAAAHCPLATREVGRRRHVSFKQEGPLRREAAPWSHPSHERVQ